MNSDDISEAVRAVFYPATMSVRDYGHQLEVDYGFGELTLDDLLRLGAILGTEPEFDGVAVEAVEADGRPGETGAPKLAIIVKRVRK